MAIKVRCRNRNCTLFNVECEISPVLSMAPGELIVCGGCGHEPRWVGGERPARTLPWNREHEQGCALPPHGRR